MDNVSSQHKYLLRNYLETNLKVSKLSSSLRVWSLCAILSVLIKEVNILVSISR